MSNEDAIYGTAVNVNCCLNLTLDIFTMNTTYCFYILKCNDGTKYYGHTNNLEKRLNRHIKGYVSSTKNKHPELVYYEEFNSCSEAFKREMQFKNGKTRKETINNLIKKFTKKNVKGLIRTYNLCRTSRSISYVLIKGEYYV